MTSQRELMWTAIQAAYRDHYGDHPDKLIDALTDAALGARVEPDRSETAPPAFTPTGHLRRPGLVDYMDAIEAGGEALDREFGDHTLQMRIVGSDITLAITPGPLLKLTAGNADLIGTTLMAWYRKALRANE